MRDIFKTLVGIDSQIAMVCVAVVLGTPGPTLSQDQSQTQSAANIPNVLLIGDSISKGYAPVVKQLMQDKANVHWPQMNCGPTTRGVEHLDAWLGDTKWDVIHFNFGLHDLKYMGPQGQNLADPGDPASHPQVPLEDYKKNLRQLVTRLKRTHAALIWCTTTPVPEGAKGRVPGDSARYNEAAKAIMQEHKIPINDLYAACVDRLAEMQQPANVHFTRDGSAELATRVVEQVQTALAGRKEKQ